eukprot:2040734-Rhodomonas_salina.1
MDRAKQRFARYLGIPTRALGYTRVLLLLPVAERVIQCYFPVCQKYWAYPGTRGTRVGSETLPIPGFPGYP